MDESPARGGYHPLVALPTRRKRFSGLRPDGTIFRSYRSQAPDASWKLLPVNGQTVRRRRFWLAIGSQRDLAVYLSTDEYDVGQPEIADLEHGGCWINQVYLERLAEVLECVPEALLDTDTRHYSADLRQEDLEAWSPDD